MSRKGAVAVAAALVLGAGALWRGTEGLTVFTAETARRTEVARSPRPLPAVALEDQRGQAFSLADLRGRVVLLEFVYTRCPTLCSLLGATFEELRAEIEGQSLDGRIALVTLSFDPVHDGPAELAEFAGRFGGADAVWTFARAGSEADTARLLRAAGVVAVPDGMGGFVHNAAIHVIDRGGLMVRILDSDAGAEALVLARSLM